MISDQDREYIITQLLSWVGLQERPREALTAPFFNTTFPQQLGQGTPDQLVREAMRLVLVDEWTHTPPWLDLLIQILPNDTKIASIREQLLHPPPPSPNPLAATILSSKIPFVGRDKLRNHLDFLVSPTGGLRPILVINGMSQIGKTYSRYYIEHFSFHRGPITPPRAELDPDVGLEIGPEQLASELVAQMGRSDSTMPPANTNIKLHVQNLALWVLKEATQTPAQKWFILDNFRGDNLRADTRAFLVALSERITTGVFPQFCRLILINFDRAELSVDPSKVEEETIQPCTLAEIQATVEEIARFAPEPLDMQQVMPLIVNDLPADQRKMSELNTRLRALLQAICEVALIMQTLPDPDDADYNEVLLEILKNLPDGKERMTELKNRLDALQAGATEVTNG